MKASKRLTQKRLKELFHYNPTTGIFTWLVNKGNARIGYKAGTKKKDGYIQIRIDRKNFLAHRLAWLYNYGYLPENCIDHINRNRSDNKIENLREVTLQCNLRNTGNSKRNTSGVKGVYWSRERKIWYAQIIYNNRLRGLGYYHSFDNAVCARLAGEQCLDWSGCDSSSPAFKYVQYITKKEVLCE